MPRPTGADAQHLFCSAIGPAATQPFITNCLGTNSCVCYGLPCDPMALPGQWERSIAGLARECEERSDWPGRSACTPCPCKPALSKQVLRPRAYGVFEYRALSFLSFSLLLSRLRHRHCSEQWSAGRDARIRAAQVPAFAGKQSPPGVLRTLLTGALPPRRWV